MRTCSDCAASEGAFHEPGCDLEECPFCLAQLMSCRCRYAELGLLQERHATTGYLPRAVYEEGLDEDAARRWAILLEARGRRRFVSPMRGDDPRLRADLVAEVVAAAASGGFVPFPTNHDILQASLIDVPGYGMLVARVYPGFVGRDPLTGASRERPPSFVVGHDTEPSGLARVRSGALVDTATACAARLDRGEDAVVWPAIGVFERGFTWHGVTRRPRASLSLSWDLEEEIVRLPVPAALARIHAIRAMHES